MADSYVPVPRSALRNSSSVVVLIVVLLLLLGAASLALLALLPKLLLYLEKNPIITINETARALDMSFNAASSAIRRLCEANILFQKGDAKRDRVFHYREYLNVLRSGT